MKSYYYPVKGSPKRITKEEWEIRRRTEGTRADTYSATSIVGDKIITTGFPLLERCKRYAGPFWLTTISHVGRTENEFIAAIWSNGTFGQAMAQHDAMMLVAGSKQGLYSNHFAEMLA